MALKSRAVHPAFDDENRKELSSIGLEAAAQAFAEADREREIEIESSPITAFLDRHEQAGSPNELTITGLGDVKVTLGDLRRFVRILR